MLCVQHIRCTNDVNGNPRRLWVGYAVDGAVERVQDEGYKGKPPSWTRGVVQIVDVNCTPREYRGWIQFWERLKKRRTTR